VFGERRRECLPAIRTRQAAGSRREQENQHENMEGAFAFCPSILHFDNSPFVPILFSIRGIKSRNLKLPSKFQLEFPCGFISPWIPRPRIRDHHFHMSAPNALVTSGWVRAASLFAILIRVPTHCGPVSREAPIRPLMLPPPAVSAFWALSGIEPTHAADLPPPPSRDRLVSSLEYPLIPSLGPTTTSILCPQDYANPPY
jgi:hypothetical protein